MFSTNHPRVTDMLIWFPTIKAHKMSQDCLLVHQNTKEQRQYTATLWRTNFLSLAHLLRTWYHTNIIVVCSTTENKVAGAVTTMPRPWVTLHLMTNRVRVSPLTSKIIFFNLASITRNGIIIYTWFRASSAACGKGRIGNTDCLALCGSSWSHTVHRRGWNARHERAQISPDTSPYVLWIRNQRQLVTCLLW